MEEDIFKNGAILPLMEEFYTLQGEGFFTGSAAYFIRIGGCDIGCRWCDTKLSWNRELHPLTPIDEILDRVESYQAPTIVVTGGEPSMYPLDYITTRAHARGIQTNIETSGAYTVTGAWDWICLSPKKNSPPFDLEIYNRCHELKMIISEPSDFEWAEANASKIHPDCKLYLQPEWSQHKIILPLIIEYVKKNTKWKVSLQAHKFMRIP